MSKGYIYLGWRHRHSETTPYVQVRGIEKGGGLRRIPFKEYTISQLLDEAKKFFFPGGKSGHAKAQKLEFCECSLGNFTGTPLSLQDADFSISRYLSDNGLFASRVRFYLLTTAKNQDYLENIDSSCESVEKHSYALSSSNESSGNVVKSATDSGVESVSKSLLHIGDSKKSFVLEFNLPT